jgi:hypothetical protein
VDEASDDGSFSIHFFDGAVCFGGETEFVLRVKGNLFEYGVLDIDHNKNWIGAVLLE